MNTMETAERICKRFHSYLNSGEYSGRVSSVTGEKLEIETSFGTVSVLNAGALQPFSCFVSGIQPFTAMELSSPSPTPTSPWIPPLRRMWI